jgi:hypothetical protein
MRAEFDLRSIFGQARWPLAFGELGSARMTDSHIPTERNANARRSGFEITAYERIGRPALGRPQRPG